MSPAVSVPWCAPICARAVLAVAGFVASVWTMGDPHDLSRKYVLTAVLAGYVGMALLVAASSVPKWWPVPERQENR